MQTESCEHSSPRTQDGTESVEPEYDFKINYRLEVRKQHLLSQLMNESIESTRKGIAKLQKLLTNDEVINKRISRKNSMNKPFKCSFCPHTYSSKAAMKQHLRLKHPEEQTPLTQPLDQQKLVEPISSL